jgi:hypothetical protein
MAQADQQRRTLYSALFAIGNRKFKIANVVVPVVQRIEGKFPKGQNAIFCRNSLMSSALSK